MFTEPELKTTAQCAEQKFNDLLKSDKGTDFDYIQNLQALAKLKNAANKGLGTIKRGQRGTVNKIRSTTYNRNNRSPERKPDYQAVLCRG